MINGRVLLLICILLAMAAQICAGNPMKTPANVPAELTLTSTQHHSDPFNELTLDVVFTGPGGKQVTVPAFWDGGHVWKVRYATPRIGTHRYQTVCSDSGDRGLNGVEGSLEVAPYRGTNALFKHGPIRVAGEHR